MDKRTSGRAAKAAKGKAAKGKAAAAGPKAKKAKAAEPPPVLPDPDPLGKMSLFSFRRETSYLGHVKNLLFGVFSYPV